MSLRTLYGALLGAAAFSLLWLPPQGVNACEPVHTISREPPTAGRICWTGPCKKTLGAVQTIGRFNVKVRLPGGGSAIIDHIIMEIEKEAGGVELIVDSRSGASCNPPASTVTGCGSGKDYKLLSAKACPGGTAPCKNSEKVHPFLTLDQVNCLKIKGNLCTLDDGQVIKAKGGRSYWVYHETCCPDLGQFGAGGSTVLTTIRYVVVDPDNPSNCEEKTTRINGRDDEIPTEQTFPCE